jgi:hypothetical protein
LIRLRHGTCTGLDLHGSVAEEEDDDEEEEEHVVSFITLVFLLALNPKTLNPKTLNPKP